jgi:hypothetical protein
MRSLIEKTRELSRRYNGLQATKDLFPQEYCQLKLSLILNDDALEQIDLRLIDLLNQHCFPCYDADYDYYQKTRERPYTGLEKISIWPLSFDSYDFHYYSAEGAGWYFVRMTSDECFDYYGYDYRALALIEQVISRLPDSHPLKLLPDVVRYVWGMTANLWLDSHLEGDNEYVLKEIEILHLEAEYQQALMAIARLRFFDCWFIANPALAQPAIANVFRQIS